MARGYRLSDRLRVLPGGAALVTPEDVMVVADLHLGCEAALEQDGLSLPRVQTRKVQRTILDLVERVRPSKLVVAGDLKHNFSRNLSQEWDDVSRFVEGLSGSVPLEVVRGNHDNYLGSILRGLGVPFLKEASVSGVRIVHGHEGALDGRPTVMGHIHPSLAPREGPRAGLKDGCFLYSEEQELLVLPAMSIVAGGVEVVGEERLRDMSPLLADVDTDALSPIAFSGTAPLRFPGIGGMRNR
ncbi:MAG: metallophosphoesterase [Candidatus Thermoplasmatota archaeon]